MLLTPSVDEIFASMELTQDWQVIPIIRTLIVSNIFVFFWLELLFLNTQTHGGWSITLLVAYSGSAIISRFWDKLFGCRDLQERGYKDLRLKSKNKQTLKTDKLKNQILG